MPLQQSNRIIIAAHTQGVGWTIASVFPSVASSLISRSVTQLEQARMAERHFRHHGLVVGTDGAVTRIVVDAVFAQELGTKTPS